MLRYGTLNLLGKKLPNKKLINADCRTEPDFCSLHYSITFSMAIDGTSDIKILRIALANDGSKPIKSNSRSIALFPTVGRFMITTLNLERNLEA